MRLSAAALHHGQQNHRSVSSSFSAPHNDDVSPGSFSPSTPLYSANYNQTHNQRRSSISSSRTASLEQISEEFGSNRNHAHLDSSSANHSNTTLTNNNTNDGSRGRGVPSPRIPLIPMAESIHSFDDDSISAAAFSTTVRDELASLRASTYILTNRHKYMHVCANNDTCFSDVTCRSAALPLHWIYVYACLCILY